MFSELQTNKTVPHFTAGYSLKDLSPFKVIFITQCYTQKVLCEKKQTNERNKNPRLKLSLEK